MKYETNVIHKGVFYPAGTDVPVEEINDNAENQNVQETTKRSKKPKVE